MPILSDITLYPIKSCGGIALQEATLTGYGLMSEQVYDREWMVVDPQGRCVTQREFPRMALIAPRITEQALEVRAPGMPALRIPLAMPPAADAGQGQGQGPAAGVQVQVWDDTVLAYDCGEQTAAWFTQAVGTPCRLARFHAGAVRPVSDKWTGGVASQTKFSDGYPVLVVGSASLDDVNDRLLAAGRAAIPMNRFRPNLVIAGIEAFEEDYAESYQIGAAVLKPVKPCSRCPMPSVDQATGQFGPDPLDILQSYRAKPEVDGAICFGMNAIVIAGDGVRLQVGQEVDVALAF